LAVTTTPARLLAEEVPEESVLSEKLAEKRVATVLPAGLVVSSRTAASDAAPVATGASFTGVTVMLRDWLRVSTPPLAVPPES
jgi:hypothetical protein